MVRAPGEFIRIDNNQEKISLPQLMGPFAFFCSIPNVVHTYIFLLSNFDHRCVRTVMVILNPIHFTILNALTSTRKTGLIVRIHLCTQFEVSIIQLIRILSVPQGTLGALPCLFPAQASIRLFVIAH
jgi:hypothetical protein